MAAGTGNPSDSATILLDLDYQEFLLSNAKIQVKRFSWSKTSLLAIEACKQCVNSSHATNNQIDAITDNSQLIYKRLIHNLSKMKTLPLSRDSNLKFINLIAASIDLIDFEIREVMRFFTKILVIHDICHKNNIK